MPDIRELPQVQDSWTVPSRATIKDAMDFGDADGATAFVLAGGGSLGAVQAGMLVELVSSRGYSRILSLAYQLAP